jgi:hypothetical protein
MAVLSVSLQNVTRETSANSTSDGGTWSNIGGGVSVTADPDIVLQGANSITSKVSNKTDAGHDFTRTTTQSVANRIWLIKIINTNNGAISGDGLRVALGNDASNQYEWQVIPTAADYPEGQDLGINKLGWWIFPIDENSTIDRTTTGSPAFGTWDYYHNIITNSTTAKSENLGTDAIDHCSATDGGLLIDGGDTAPAGTFDDFTAFDDGDTSNRYGIAVGYQGKNFAVGTWRIADATLTEFTSVGESVTWINSRTPAGFNRLHIDLQTSGTIVAISLGTLDSVGAATWSAGAISTDTRPDLFVENTTGTLALTDHNVIGFRNVTLTSACTLSGCTFDLFDIAWSTATVADCGITTTAIDGTAACDDLSLADQTDLGFVKGIRAPTTDIPGTGHAVEFTSAGTKTTDAFTWSGYDAVSTFDTITGVDAGTEVITTDAAHGLASGQRVYYNKNGGTDSVGLTAHSTAYFVNVLSTTTLSLHTTLATAIADTSRVDLSDGSTGETHWLEPGATAIYNSSGGAVSVELTGHVGDLPEARNSTGSTTTISAAVSVQIEALDQSNNPVASAQTSIYLTADDSEVLNTDTNAAGIASGSFTGSTPADVYWRVRKASPGDTKYTGLSGVGTIASSTGFSITVTLSVNPNNNS